MEGVGARLGRSSTRYGPATVFTGPVRKWKKKWIHVAPSTTASNNHSHSQRHTNPNNVTANATANSSTNASHLLLFKWTPITQSLNNGNADEKNAGKEDTPTVTEEPPRRKFKYMPAIGKCGPLSYRDNLTASLSTQYGAYVLFRLPVGV
uniref:Uncharacterized protein n=1 Tax=Cucumis sativus TaxID=3659 RepID=A0A0A0LT57_CUCSA